MSTNLEDVMRSNSNEPEGSVLIDGFDPDLLDAVVPAVIGVGGPEALLALLRERGDPRLSGITELFQAECPWPVPAPTRGRVRLAAGRPGGNAWEIELVPPAWELSYMCDEPDDWDFDDPGGDDPDHEAGGEGWAFGSFGVSGFRDDEGDHPVVAPVCADRGDLEAGFASCKWQILLILLEVFPDLILRWVTVVRGDIGAALHALRGVYDPDIQISDDPKMKWAARWLIAIARLYPARHAALMAALWAVPRLHRAGYQVLGVTHPGWTELLPEFAPPAPPRRSPPSSGGETRDPPASSLTGWPRGGRPPSSGPPGHAESDVVLPHGSERAERGSGVSAGGITMPSQPNGARQRAGGSPRGPRRVVRPRTTFVIPPYDHGEEAEGYSRRGLSVIPLVPNSKTALIKWKTYQTQAPTPDEVDRWWQTWPDAGMAVVLGPVGGVFAVDVDGKDAHDELVRRLGAEPAAPKILTGSRKPFRYQLLFRHPEGVDTRAKFTPWHPQLEFRGRGGLTVLPPSVHQSGKRYRWAPGRSLVELALGDVPLPIRDALRDRADVGAGRGSGSEHGIAVPPDRLGGVQRRALALITKELTAVEGNGGDKATFTAACYLVRDFALSVDQALPVIRAWNRTHCRPKWSDDQLLHKLRKADEWTGRRGRLLGSVLSLPGEGRDTAGSTRAVAESPGWATPTAPPLSARPAFLLPLPNWVLSCWEFAKPRVPDVRRGRPPKAAGVMFPLLLASVVLQKSSVVQISDVALAQLRWGGNRAKWPVRWRAKMDLWLARFVDLGWFKVKDKGADCPVRCTLHGTRDIRHRHLRLFVAHNDILGFCHPFATGGTKENGFTYRFDGLRSHHPNEDVAKAKTKKIRELPKQGRLFSIYLPAWVFGPLALPPGPCRVLKAVTHELTRQRGGRAERADRAELLSGAANPVLDAARSYVAFNGNGTRSKPQYHGRGYSLGTWMRRAGYPHDPGSPSFRTEAGEFLADLKSLSGPLGLVAAVRVPGRDGWATIDEAIGEVAIVRPHRLARKCLIRLYGPADYPDRWRAYFASELGLGAIPRGEPGEEEPASADGVINTPEQLARWMAATGLTDTGLAEKLGVSRTLVCLYRKGSRSLSTGFRAKLATVSNRLAE